MPEEKWTWNISTIKAGQQKTITRMQSPTPPLKKHQSAVEGLGFSSPPSAWQGIVPIEGFPEISDPFSGIPIISIIML